MAEECPVDLKGIRIKYKNSNEAFTEKDIPIKDPFNQFDIWIKEAINDKSIIEPNAMCLSTATKDGIPSGRFVLLKEYGNKQGFKFFTNSISRKGQELKENPHAALTAYWPSLNRSIRIEGITELLPQEESVEYFSQRPYASQIGALASNQSAPIPSREDLCRKGEEMQKLYPDKKDVIKPSTWNGYKLVPNSLEFWQGQSDRMHDRIRFRKLKLNEKPDGVLLHEGVNGWVYERLAP